MKRSIRLSGILATALLTAVVAPVAAQEFKTDLTGYEETPLTINSNASGEFTAKIVKLKSGGTAIDYELTYRDLSSAVQQAHIHFGRPATSGLPSAPGQNYRNLDGGRCHRPSHPGD